MLTSAFRAIVNNPFEESFDTTFMRNEKNVKTLLFFPIKSFFNVKTFFPINNYFLGLEVTAFNEIWLSVLYFVNLGIT